MADGVEIGKGYVAIDADMTQFNAFAKALPSKFTEAAKAAKAGWNAVWLDGQMTGQLDKVGAAATRAGNQAKQAGTSGAHGLLIMSQTIDDMQYGLSAVVNNMPQVGMAIGNALGVSTEKAMAFGGAMGIAAVAVNTWVKQADHVKAIFGGSQSDDVKELTTQLTALGDTARSVFASIASLDKGFNWVKTTGKDVDALTKQMNDKKTFEAETAARAKHNRGAVEGIKERGADERGAAFGKAAEAFGGGDKLANEIANKRMSKANMGMGTAEERTAREKKIRESVDADIAAAKEGDKGAIAGLAKEDPKLKGLIAYNAPGMREARDKEKGKNDAAAGRTAKGLEDTVGRDLLKTPDMGVSELWAKVKEAMEKAGYSTKEIADTLPAVATKIKADIEGKVKERADRDNISPGAARTMMLSEAAERDKGKMEQGLAPLTREAERLAGAMEGGAGRKILENGGIGDAELEGNVRKGLKSAGVADSKIDEVAVLVARKLREKVESQVQERALDQGVSEGKAREDMLKEANEKDNRDRPKAEVMSTESYMSKLLVAGASRSGKDDVPAKQLTEQQTTNKTLAEIRKELSKKQKNGPATFGRGRS